MNLNVVIIEDDPRYRHSLVTLFNNTAGFQLGASFGSAYAMLDQLESLQQAGRQPSWQLALVDIELPGMNGIEATRYLKKLLPALTVVMLTVFEEPAVILEAISAGADGYLLKKTPARELLSQLNAVLHSLLMSRARCLRSCARKHRREFQENSSAVLHPLNST